MLNLFLTIDVELWPRSWDRLGPADAREAYARYIVGRTPRGDYGLGFQLGLLREHGLRAVCFVEPLFSVGWGEAMLADIVGLINDAGHEVQLHLHAEWHDKFPQALLPGRTGLNLRDFGLEDQHHLLALGLERLRRAGAERIVAFRAGSYGADRHTLAALARLGIAFDTSYNRAYLASSCGLATAAPLLQPTRLGEAWEFPIGFFEGPGGRARHAQLAACSAAELMRLCDGAFEAGWYAQVLVSHGCELLNADRTRPDPVVIGRLERLCRHLADHRERFAARGIAGLDPATIPAIVAAAPLRGSPWHAGWRYGEQLWRRIYG